MTDVQSGFVPFDPAEVDRRFKAQYGAGWYYGKITRVTASRAKSKNDLKGPDGDQSPNYFQFGIELKALRDPTNPKSEVSKPIMTWVRLPFEPQDWAGRILPDNLATYKAELEDAEYDSAKAMTVLFPDAVPAFPTKKDDHWYFKGEPLKDGGYEDAKKEVILAARPVLEKLYAEKGAGMLNKVVVFGTYAQKDTGEIKVSSTFYLDPPERDGAQVQIKTGDQILAVPEETAGGNGTSHGSNGKKNGKR